MCILFIKLLKATIPGEFKLILASNRDEFFKRPGKSAHYWEEDANIFGGRDMTESKQGGTWLAMSKKGRIGVLLNLSGEETNPKKLGRGFLVADYLKTPLTDKEYLDTVIEEGHKYNKFHLITTILGSKNPKIFHVTNGENGKLTEIDNGILAVGNSALYTPFEKVKKGRERFEDVCNKYGREETRNELVNELLELLKWDEQHYPDEIIDRIYAHIPQIRSKHSSVFVNMNDVPFGTRTHTIILVDHNNKVEFHEWTLKDPIIPSNKIWTETHERFTINPNGTYIINFINIRERAQGDSATGNEYRTHHDG